MINNYITTLLLKALLLCVGCIISVNGIGQELKPGDVIWSFPVFNIKPSTPAIDNNGIYFTEGRDLFSIGRNGDFKWRKNNIDIDSAPYAPAVTTEGNIFVRLTSNRENIYSFIPSGKVAWDMINNYKFKSNPAMSYNGDFYIIGQKQGLEAGRKSGLVSIGINKKVKWEFYKSNIDIFGNPAIASNNVIYIFGRDVTLGINRLYAISQEGVEIWSYETDDIKRTSFAIDKDNTIYFGGNNKLYSINNLGNLKWAFESSARITSSPAIDQNGAIYFGSGSELVSINGDGTKRWAYKSYGVIETSPAIDNENNIYFGTKKKVFAINETGEKEWELELAANIFWPDGIKNSPAIDSDGTLFIAANRLYAIKTSSSGPANSAWPMLGQNSRRTYSVSMPVIIEGPKSLVALKQQKANFYVEAKGTQPLSYQWYKNDIPIEGEIHSSLELGNTVVSDEGKYSVRVKNIFGDSISNEANLLVPASDTIILIDDEFVLGETSGVDSVEIKIKSNILESEIFYTIDGSKPSFTSIPYTEPFELNKNATIRAIAYSRDFTKLAESEPTKLNILKTFVLTLENRGGGSASIDSPHNSHIEGTKLTVTAKPEGDWEFIKWEGASESTSPTITVTMDSDKTLQPVFGTNLKVNTIGGGKVIQRPENPVPYGTFVTFEALPDEGNYFYRWAGDTNKEIVNTIGFSIDTPELSISALFDDMNNLKAGDRIWFHYSSGPSAISHNELVIYYKHHGNISAVDKNSGILKWEAKEGNWTVSSSSFAINKDNVLFFPANEFLYAVNCNNGEFLWKRKLANSSRASPSVFNSTVLIPSGENLIALNSKNGDLLWDISLAYKVYHQPVISQDDIVYITAGSMLMAVNNLGTKRWHKYFNTIYSQPIINNRSTIFFSEKNGDFNSFSNSNVNNSWIANTGTSHLSPVIDTSGNIIFPSSNKIYSISPNTGKINWSSNTDASNSSFGNSPAIDNKGIIYIGADKTLYAIDSNNGSVRWRYKTERSIVGPSMIEDSILYFGTQKGLHAIKIEGTGPANSAWPMFSQNPQRTGKIKSFIDTSLPITILNKQIIPFQIKFKTANGSSYEFQASSDLKKWSKLQEVKGTGNDVEVSDQRKAIFRQQYYRIKLVE